MTMTEAAALQTMIDNTPHGIALFDSTLRLRRWNREWIRINNYPEGLVRAGVRLETLLDHSVAAGDHGPDGARRRDEILDQFRSGRPFRYTRLSGGDRSLSVSTVPTAAGDLVITYTDITELANVEAEIAERRKAEEALIEATRDAESANRAKSEFLANMSHELRTPLNVIIGITEMLGEDAEADGLEDYAEPLSRVRRAGEHLLSLINDILDLSKIEAGKLEIHSESVEIAPLLRDVIASVRPLATKNGNALGLACPPGIGAVTTDPLRLRQVLLNIVGNACKFTKDGTIDVSAMREGDGPSAIVRFVVADTGIGISAEQQTKLFRRFAQAEPSTTKQYGGSGLGLAISDRLCRMMGGHIELDSVPGRGSTFTIMLPAAAAAGERPAVEPARLSEHAVVPGPDARGRVLVIEDDPTAAELLERRLQEEGFEVVVTTDGSSGLRLARETKPAIITLDLGLPDVNGLDVLAALKADKDLADTPILVISVADEEKKCFALGASGYLVKPVDRKRLKALISHYTGRESAKRILVVEDHEDTRFLFRRLLEEHGMTVAEAGDGAEALAAMTEFSPDLVLLDLVLPGMDGFGFAEEIRRRAEWDEVPIIAVTAKELDRNHRQRLEARVEEVFFKGAYSPENLLAAIRQAVGDAAPIGPRVPAAATGEGGNGVARGEEA